jgi:hypothetical protein
LKGRSQFKMIAIGLVFFAYFCSMAVGLGMATFVTLDLIGLKVLCAPTEYAELQPLLSAVHSVMRVGGAGPPLLITFTTTSKVAVYAPAGWADTLTLFHF